MEAQRSLSQNPTTDRPSQFSDAYFSGMPAKKRKLFGPNELNNENIFKTVLNRTLKQVQLKPNVRESEVSEVALSRSELTTEFDSELDRALTERVRTDPEFNPTLDMNSQSDDCVYNRNRFALSKKRVDS
jgi:hypothetical protein